MANQQRRVVQTRVPARLGLLPFIAAMTILSSGVLAQEYPTRFVKIVVPFEPGGATDLIARPYAQKMQSALGQPVVLEHKPGAGATIGTNAVAKAAPNGYTMLLASFSFPLNPILESKLPYDPFTDFAPVSMLGKSPAVVVVNPALPLRSIKELVAYAKQRPGELNFSVTGPAATGTLAALSFQSLTGVEMKAIPYKGAGPGNAAVVSGEVHLSFPNIAPSVALIKSGKLRALAVTGSQRSNLIPDVPTIAEEGVSGYEEGGWYGILMPKGTPQAIVMRVNKETIQALASDDIKKVYNALGIDPVSSTPAEFTTFILAQHKKFSKLLKP